jgi:hypothetical protein
MSFGVLPERNTLLGLVIVLGLVMVPERAAQERPAVSPPVCVCVCVCVCASHTRIYSVSTVDVYNSYACTVMHVYIYIYI